MNIGLNKMSSSTSMSSSSAAASDWKEQVMKILNKISAKKEAEDFKHPVPWQQLGLLDYPEVKAHVVAADGAVLLYAL
jgi:hypothetical protein